MVRRPIDSSIETLRGLAVVLMVAGHVIGSENRGLMPADRSLLHYLYYCFQYLRLPLFTAIGGFIYAGWPADAASSWTIIRRKACRLLTPFLTVSTIQFLVQVEVPSVHARVRLAELPHIYVWPHDQFWYLPALFGIFVIVVALDVLGALSRPRYWAAALGVSALLRIAIHFQSTAFAAWGILFLLPAFLLGYGLRRFGVMLAHTMVLGIAAVGFAISYAVQQLVYFGDVRLSAIDTEVLSLAVGLTALTLLFRWRRNAGTLAWLGEYSYSIYLLHIFGTAGMRIGATSMGLHQVAALFVLSIAGGLAFPIVVHRALASSPVANALLLGNFPRRIGRLRSAATAGPSCQPMATAFRGAA